MWNETNPTRRRKVIEATWTSDASYVDPMFDAEGLGALDAMVVVHKQFLGHRFRPSGVVDIHNDHARWGWELVGPDDGPTVAADVDFAVLAPDAGCARSLDSSSSRPTLPEFRRSYA
jgi:hypothetical protein